MPPVLGLYGLSRNSHSSKGYSLVPFPDALDLLHYSLAHGISLFDTAPGYGNGNASRLLAALSRTSSDFFVNSKIGLDIESNHFNLSLIRPHLDHLASFPFFNYSTIFLHSPPCRVIQDFDLILSLKELIVSILGSHVKFGISLASPSDFTGLNQVLSIIDSLQVNLSWLDLRFLPFLSYLDLPIFARSVYGSGLIPHIVSSKSYEHLLDFPPTFSPQDDRSSWDMSTFLPRVEHDIRRIFSVSQILNTSNSSIIASSLFNVLPSNIIPVVGSLSISELQQYIESASRPISNQSLAQLSSLVSA